MLSEPRRRETFPLDVVAFAVVVKRFLFIETKWFLLRPSPQGSKSGESLGPIQVASMLIHKFCQTCSTIMSSHFIPVFVHTEPMKYSTVRSTVRRKE